MVNQGRGAVERSNDRIAVLIVGINYEPEHTGIAPYTSEFARYLKEAGLEVSVLSGIPHYPGWTVPRAYRYRLSFDEVIARVKVRRLRHYVPDRQSAIRRAWYEGSFAFRVVTQRINVRPDVVVAVVPSLLGAASAWLIARRYRLPMMVWVQDLMGLAATQSGIAGGLRVSSIALAVERAVLKRATRVVVLNDGFKAHLIAAGVNPQRISIRPNWTHIPPPTLTRSECRAGLGWADNEIVALHSGNMGLKQDLRNVVEAARLVRNEDGMRVRFVLMGDGSQRAELERLGRQVRFLSIRPSADVAEFTSILSAADVLLVNERFSVADMSVPSKLTSYFRAGRPVVAAVSPGGGTAQEVQRSGAGLIVPSGNPDLLLQAVINLASDQLLCERMGSAATAYCENSLDANSALSELMSLVFACASR